MRTFTQQSKSKKSSYLFAKEPFALILATLVCMSFTSVAGTYKTFTDGKYSASTVWQTGYPGNMIKENDTVYINSKVEMTSDIIVKGILIVTESSLLTGNYSLIVTETGYFSNRGLTLTKAVNNKGVLTNHHILEVSGDMINSGKIKNNQSILVGNITDNLGEISGNKGYFISNKQFVNNATGTLKGNTDYCSNAFSSLNGAKLDSANISFCGNRIFTSTYLTASVKLQGIQINLNNPSQSFSAYKIEKSSDGENYTTIATVKRNEIKEPTETFRYNDPTPLKSDELFYRVSIVNTNGSEQMVPAVKVLSKPQYAGIAKL